MSERETVRMKIQSNENQSRNSQNEKTVEKQSCRNVRTRTLPKSEKQSEREYSRDGQRERREMYCCAELHYMRHIKCVSPGDFFTDAAYFLRAVTFAITQGIRGRFGRLLGRNLPGPSFEGGQAHSVGGGIPRTARCGASPLPRSDERAEELPVAPPGEDAALQIQGKGLNLLQIFGRLKRKAHVGR